MVKISPDLPVTLPPLSVVELHISQPRIRSVYHYNILEHFLQAATIVSLILVILVISIVYMSEHGVDKGFNDYIEKTKGPITFWVNMILLFGSLMINFVSDRKDKYLINYVVDHVKNDKELQDLDAKPFYEKIPNAIRDILSKESMELSHVTKASRDSVISIPDTVRRKSLM
jgi:fumarate reductase subunit C